MRFARQRWIQYVIEHFPLVYNCRLRVAASLGQWEPLSAYFQRLGHQGWGPSDQPCKDSGQPQSAMCLRWQLKTWSWVSYTWELKEAPVNTQGFAEKAIAVLCLNSELCADLNWEQNSALNSLLSEYRPKYWPSLTFPEYWSQRSGTRGNFASAGHSKTCV